MGMTTNKKTRISLWLPDSLLKELDSIRGADLSRTALIKLLLEESCREVKRKGGLQLKIYED